MKQVVLITFGVLGWAWYELSGGADFEPGQRGVQILASVDAQPASSVEQQPDVSRPEVSRLDMASADLASVAPVRQISVTPAKAAQVTPAVVRTQTAPTEAAVPFDTAKVSALLDETEAADAAEPQIDDLDYRVVTGSRVNLRQGPSTTYQVVTQLLQGEEVEVLDDTGDGWVRLRALDGDNIGWMSDSFLVAAN